jgi:hypothetical protein
MIRQQNNLELKTVKKTDFEFLYNILKDRNPIANISHEKMPSYKQHIEFVKSKPYTKWYIIYVTKMKIGTIYLSKQDEIGIHMIKEKQFIGIEEKSIKILMGKNPRKKYTINSSIRNKKLIKLLEKNGFKRVQYSYVLMNKNEI